MYLVFGENYFIDKKKFLKLNKKLNKIKFY